MTFTLDYMYNTTEKAKYLERRKKDLEEYYQQNYFSERKNQIVTRPIRHIEFISSGLKTQPFESVSLGIKIVNIDTSNSLIMNITSSYGRLLYIGHLKSKNQSYFNLEAMNSQGFGL